MPPLLSGSFWLVFWEAFCGVFYDPPRLVSLDLALVLEIRGCGEVTVEDLLVNYEPTYCATD